MCDICAISPQLGKKEIHADRDELLLDLFVGIVDTKLFKAVHFERLETERKENLGNITVKKDNSVISCLGTFW